MSKLIEKCVMTMGDQYDPGRACETVAKILRIVEEAMNQSRTENDPDRLQALEVLRNDLDPYVKVCELTKPEKDGKLASLTLVKKT